LGGVCVSCGALCGSGGSLLSPTAARPLHPSIALRAGTVAVGVMHRPATGRAATGYSLRLLRGFELSQDDEVVRLPLSAQRLAAFLALQDRPLHRVHVAGMLWIDSTEEHANASLRTALWRLRRVGLPLVVATSTHLMLSDRVPVDVRETATCAKRILRGDASLAHDLGTLEQAGELLPDWYDDWVLIERERLRQLYVHALERLSVEARVAGRFAQAAQAGLAAVAFEPLRESAHRVVIEAHLAEGNPSEAIRQYRLFERFLQSRLGLEPSMLMQELVKKLPLRDDSVTERRAIG